MNLLKSITPDSNQHTLEKLSSKRETNKAHDYSEIPNHHDFINKAQIPRTTALPVVSQGHETHQDRHRNSHRGRGAAIHSP